MYKILEVMSFGFVLELQNDFCYFAKTEYDIFIDDKLTLTSNKNVVSIFGLNPNTKYNIKIKQNDIVLEQFVLETSVCEYILNIKDYGALGDGTSDDTSAFMLALYTAPKNSTIFVPKGTYLLDYILLKSDINIYFDKGVVIKQNVFKQKMPVIKALQKDYDFKNAIINTTWEGNPLDSYCPLIYGNKVSNIKIYGDAIIDGNGDISGFWDTFRKKGITYRPKNIELVNSRDVSIIGISSLNSSSWNVHLLFCNNINAFDLYLKSIDTSPNTDGINPEASKNITIKGCKISVGDDCIAVKSGKYFISKYYYANSENIFIENCYLKKGHGGIVLGSEISCGANNILVKKCIFKNTDRGIRLKTRRGRGETSIIDNITVDNCIMNGVKNCVTVNMFYYCDPDGKSDYVQNKNMQLKDEFTPSIKNIVLKNIKATQIKGTAFYIYGLPESPVESLKVLNSTFEFSKVRTSEPPEMQDGLVDDEKLGIYLKNISEVDFLDVTFEGEYTKIIDKSLKI